MKKSILSIMLGALFVTANASNFNILVSKEHNDYKSTTNSSTEWVVVETNVCSVDNESSSFYYGEKFDQHEVCIDKEERILSQTVVDENGNKQTSTITEQREVLLSDTNTEKLGSHVENNCEDILNNGYASGNKEYRVGFNNSDVYCDMTNGGWMRLTNYDFAENPDNVPPNMNKRIDYSYTSYVGSHYTLTNGWYGDFLTDSMLSANPSGLFWAEVNADTNGFAWGETKIELDTIQGITPDSFNVYTTNGRDTVTINGQYLDGFSVTYGVQGNRKHIHSLVRGTGSVTRTGLEWLVADGNYTGTEITPGHQADQILSFSSPSRTSEDISVRLMTNQNYTDEIVGITKFKVWVK